MAFQEHQRIWDQPGAGTGPVNVVGKPFRPIATYALLAAMAAVFILEYIVYSAKTTMSYRGETWYAYGLLFPIDIDWASRPWTLVTSTFSHSVTRPNHILFNALTLFFVAPTIERVIGPKRVILLFVAGGAITGLAQVYLTHALGEPITAALGASGAIMLLLGILILLFPRQKALLFGIVPVPLWAMGVGYVVLDILGTFDPTSRIGNFAHLSGMALGLAYGLYVKADLRRRGLKWVSH